MVLGVGIDCTFSDPMSDIQGFGTTCELECEMPDIVEPEWFTRLMNSPPGSLDNLFTPSERPKQTRATSTRETADSEIIMCRSCKALKPMSEYYRNPNNPEKTIPLWKGQQDGKR